MNNTPLALIRLSNPEEQSRNFANAANAAILGKLNVLVSVTLTANAASTTISDNRIGPNTIALLCQTTANAAAALATTYQTWPNAAVGSLVLHHANNAQVDKTFVAALVGS